MPPKMAHNIAQPIIICWWPYSWFLIMVKKDTDAAAAAADENYANGKTNDVISSFIII